MASSAGTAPLLECSICLDRFTDPRMLPCQHTFCLQCVIDLVGDDEVTIVTCPQCRARHTLPPGRVQGLPGNLVINNLLSLPVESPTASAQNPECADCKEKGPVSLCCQERVCVECRVLHDRLSRDIQQTLDQLRESLSTPGGSTERVKASLRAVKIERERMNAAVQEQADSLLQALEIRQTQLDAIFQTLVGVHEDLLQPAGRKPFLENVSRQAAKTKNTQSLKQLKESLEEVKTYASLVHRQQTGVKFSSVPLEMDFENWGRIQFGDSAVDVASGIETLTLTDATSGPDASAAGAEGPPVLRSHPRQAAVGGVPRNVTATSRFGVTQSNRQSRPIRSMHPQPGNALPRNVNYREKARATALVIGPELRLGERETKLEGPTNCVYNAHTDELLVCDQDNDRVLAMKTDGTDVRVLYKTNKPRDIAVSDDGQDVFIQTHGPAKIHRVSISGCHNKTINSFSEGAFDTIWSVLYHNQQVAVLHEKPNSVVLFNTSLEQTRSFRVEDVQDPRAMTVDSDGNFYITDRKTGAVHVYTWGGQHTRSFGAVSGWGYSPPGICVDGDGVVCVSRFFEDRVGVYDREGRQVTTLGRKGTSPGKFNGPRGLHLLPDGRIVVADSQNNRLQIL